MRIDRRAERYDHALVRLPDGRVLATRKAAAYLGHLDDARQLIEIGRAQQQRWAAGRSRPGEDPIEVLCTVTPRMVLLDTDALAAALARRQLDRTGWKPLDVE